MLVLKLIVIVVAAVALVAGVRALLRRTLSPTSLQHAEKAIPFLLGSISGFYGLIAGFMLSNSYAELRLLQGAMTSEISALAQLPKLEMVRLSLCQRISDFTPLRDLVRRGGAVIVDDEFKPQIDALRK